MYISLKANLCKTVKRLAQESQEKKTNPSSDDCKYTGVNQLQKTLNTKDFTQQSFDSIQYLLRDQSRLKEMFLSQYVLKNDKTRKIQLASFLLQCYIRLFLLKECYNVNFYQTLYRKH